MQITVKGKNLDVPSHIRDGAIAKLSKVTRLFDRMIDMEVVFSEDHNPRIEDRIHCEVTLHAKGRILRASAAAPDPLTAIDRAESKLTAQVRKLKTKLVTRARTSNGHATAGGPLGPALVPAADEEG